MLDDEQKRHAEASKQVAEEVLGQSLVTPIEVAGPFYKAKAYHQNYYQTNPNRYKFYRWRCGRNQTVEAIWGDQAYQGIPTH